jgi:hypothetical protein
VAVAEGPRQERVRNLIDELKESVFQGQQCTSRAFGIIPGQRRGGPGIHGQFWWLPVLKNSWGAMRGRRNVVSPTRSQLDAPTDLFLLPFLPDLLPSPGCEQFDAEQRGCLGGLPRAHSVDGRDVRSRKISQVRRPVLSVNEPWQ